MPDVVYVLRESAVCHEEFDVWRESVADWASRDALRVNVVGGLD
jgi:hypothetical protein